MIVTSSALKRFAEKNIKKAKGADDWGAGQLRLLPDTFFQRLAEVWTAVLEGADLPAAWLHVRVVLIPKQEGGEWPISIAALAWRIGMSATLHKL